MSLALGILLGWLGAALLWVSFHGLGSQDATPAGVISTIEQNVTGSTG